SPGPRTGSAVHPARGRAGPARGHGPPDRWAHRVPVGPAPPQRPARRRPDPQPPVLRPPPAVAHQSAGDGDRPPVEPLPAVPGDPAPRLPGVRRKPARRLPRRVVVRPVLEAGGGIPDSSGMARRRPRRPTSPTGRALNR